MTPTPANWAALTGGPAGGGARGGVAPRVRFKAATCNRTVRWDSEPLAFLARPSKRPYLCAFRVPVEAEGGNEEIEMVGCKYAEYITTQTILIGNEYSIDDFHAHLCAKENTHWEKPSEYMWRPGHCFDSFAGSVKKSDAKTRPDSTLAGDEVGHIFLSALFMHFFLVSVYDTPPTCHLGVAIQTGRQPSARFASSQRYFPSPSAYQRHISRH